MSAGFTPGPWERRADTICKADERGVQRHIAYLCWPDDEQGNAEAHLIAAAPDLLEVLEDLIRKGAIDTPSCRADALDAIAKARGVA